MALTARQDIFIRRLLEGDSQRKAYRAAFPSSQKWKDSTVDSKASALFNSDKVQERYHFLKTELDNKSIMHRTERMITLSKIAEKTARMPGIESAPLMCSIKWTAITSKRWRLQRRMTAR